MMKIMRNAEVNHRLTQINTENLQREKEREIRKKRIFMVKKKEANFICHAELVSVSP